METIILLLLICAAIVGFIQGASGSKQSYRVKENNKKKEENICDPRVEQAIKTLKACGYSAKDSKHYVQKALENGCEDLVSGALEKVEI